MSAAEGVLTLTALFQDEATAGLQAFTNNLNAAASAASQAQSGLSPLNNVLGTTATEVAAASGAFAPFSSAVRETGSAVNETTPGFVGMGNALGTTSEQARGIIGPMGALNSSFQGVAKGGLDVTNTLQPIPSMMNQGSIAAGGFGTALKNNALAISAVAATAVGLVEGLTSIERAHARVESSQTRLTSAEINAQKSQDLLNTAIQKYGPNSEQARLAAENHTRAMQALQAAQDNANVAQSRYDDTIASFVANLAPQVILMAGGIVQIFSQVEGLGTKLVGVFTSIGSAMSSAITSFVGVETGAEGAAVGVQSLSTSLTALAAVVGIPMLIVAGVFAVASAISSNAPAIHGFFQGVATEIKPLGPQAQQMATQFGQAFQETGNFLNDAKNKFTDFVGVTKNAFKDFSQARSSDLENFRNYGTTGNSIWDSIITKEVNAQIQHDNVTKHMNQSWNGALNEMIAGYKNFESQHGTITNSVGDQLNQLTQLSDKDWKDMETASVDALNNVSGTITKFGNDVQAMSSKASGVVPQLAGTFKTAGAQIVESIAAIDAQYANMNKQIAAGEGEAAIEKFSKAVVLNLADVYGALVKSGQGSSQFAQLVNKSMADAIEAAHGVHGAYSTLVTQDLPQLSTMLNNAAGATKNNADNTNNLATAYGGIDGIIKQSVTTYNQLISSQQNATQTGQAMAVEIEHTYNLTQLSTMASHGFLAVLQNMGPAGQVAANALIQYAAAHGVKIKAEQDSVKATSSVVDSLQQEKDSLTQATTKEQLAAAATMQLYNANQFAAKGVADAAKAYADAAAKFEAYIGEFSNGTSITNLYNAAVVDGKNKLLEFVLQTQQSVVSDTEFHNSLSQLVGSMGFFKTGLEATTQNMETFYKAAYGDQQAMAEMKKTAQDLVGGLAGLADEVGNKLADALNKGTKDFGKAMKDLEQESGITFDPDFKFRLTLQAELDQAKGILKGDVSELAGVIEQGGNNDVGPATQGMMQHLLSIMKNVSPQITGTFEKVFQDLRNIANQPWNPQFITQLRTDLGNVGLSAQQVDQVMGGLLGKIQGAGGDFSKFSAAVQAAANYFKTLGDNVSNTTGIVTNSAGAMVGKIDLTTGAFHTATGAATDFNTQIQHFGDLASVAQVTFQNMATQAQTLSTQLDTTFKAAVASIAPSFGTLASLFQVTMNNMVTQVTTALPKIVTLFQTMERGINTVLTGLTADIQRFVTTGLVDSMQRGMSNTLNIVNTDFGAIERNINTDMTSAATDVNTQTGRMLSAVNTNFGAILRSINDDMNNAVRDVTNAGSRIISEFNAIGNSALSQVSKINSLISRMNAIPNISRTITITTVFRTVGSPSGGGGGGGQPTQLFSPVTGASGSTTAVTNTQPIVVQAPQNNQPIIVQLDGVVVGRMIRKNLFGINSGGIT